MRVGVLVNTRRLGDASLTTYLLATDLHRRGHEVWLIGASDFAFDADGDAILALGRSVKGEFRSSKRYLEALSGDGAIRRWIDVARLDVLLLRMNPFVLKDWAVNGGLDFARLAKRRGVLVLNDPATLSRASSKLYPQFLAREARPETLITRDLKRIEGFLERHGKIVLKPLEGYAGRNVFFASADDRVNFGGIVKAISRDGYVVAQEYLPAAAVGDTRLYLVNGRPLEHEGRYAVIRRARTGDDLRSNVHAGGRPEPGRIDEGLLSLAERVRPELEADGMFFVALDIAGDKIMEINVFSPGGLAELQEFEQVNFARAITQAIEKKLAERGS